MELNAAHLHLVLNHIPILGFGLGLLLVAWGRWRRSDEVARAGLAVFLLAGLVSVAVFFSGEGAEEVVEGMSGVSHDLIEAHEEAGKLAMIVSVVVGVFSGFGLFRSRDATPPRWVKVGSTLGALVAFGFLTYTALQGGRIQHEELRSEVGAVGVADPSSEPAQERVESGEASTRIALPGLYSIMVGLQGNMTRISRGLWTEELDTVAAGAAAVADHPRVPPDEFDRISEVLGEEMSRFGGMDVEVHDLAVRLAEEARAGDLQAVLSTDAELRRACLSCHTNFRDRLRREIP